MESFQIIGTAGVFAHDGETDADRMNADVPPAEEKARGRSREHGPGRGPRVPLASET